MMYHDKTWYIMIHHEIIITTKTLPEIAEAFFVVDWVARHSAPCSMRVAMRSIIASSSFLEGLK